MQLLGYSISICPFNYPPKSQFSPFVLLGVFVLRNFAKVFINLFFIFLSFFFGVGPMKHTPFFHNTPFQFWWPLAKKIALLLPLLDMNPNILYIKKTHTQEELQLCFGWLFDAFLFHYKCVLLEGGVSSETFDAIFFIFVFKEVVGLWVVVCWVVPFKTSYWAHGEGGEICEAAGW